MKYKINKKKIMFTFYSPAAEAAVGGQRESETQNLQNRGVGGGPKSGILGVRGGQNRENPGFWGPGG
jgi:hypothetical protein